MYQSKLILLMSNEKDETVVCLVTVIFRNVDNIGQTRLPKFIVFFSSVIPLAITTVITVGGVSVLKPEVDWIDAEEQASVGNARALNPILNGVDLNVFKLINFCSTAKEAWRILEVAYKGTSKVKISKLQLITSKFEALKMSEDESVSEYNERVLEITNESLLLGETIPNSKIVRKMLGLYRGNLT
ncbi:gag-pol polyprotein [Cucumis melo var. makuwa]|uniref:Gag-pol polyprotein n=1 Tax=Cucumis melo var. makuwa TaxID=1194695 RepID=A0A5A7UJA1_CUCMM|nr:gag-pol polyprotein [Cucumis melo var. makuwa]TYK19124.1 gag-pol polyprotein [Cucumis melo var. makuwa]